jgi:hypothetical protein
VIHIVAVSRLGGSAVAAAVMCYDAIALLEKEQHLRVPVIGRQWPAMAENDGLTFAPVLVKNLCAVFCCDRTHVLYSSLIANDADDPAPTFQWPGGDRRLPIRISIAALFTHGNIRYRPTQAVVVRTDLIDLHHAIEGERDPTGAESLTTVAYAACSS